MHIENPDAFKSWLTSVLEPLCDADPEALAKYVFALVKKDKSIDILRQGMMEQLDVFLQAETKPFVDLLFKTIESQEYLIIPNTNPPNPHFTPKKSPEIHVKDIKPIIPVSTLPNLTESLNGVKKPATEEKEVVSTTTSTTVPKRTEERRRRRSRSRSWDRRSPRRRPWRNKSPPRRAWRSRSRSPRHGGSRSGRYRNRSPPPRSTTRSRSRSGVRSPPERSARDKKKDDKQPDNENSGAATPTQDSNHGDTDMRLTSTTQSIQSVVAASSGSAGTVGPPSSVVASAEPFKRRCRDFDEKGYCMRGEMCPYDHGIDPVVLEDSALSRVLTFGGAPPAGPQITPQLRPPHHINMHQPPGPLAPPGVIVEYNPQNPAMWRGIRPPRGVIGGPGGPPMHGQTQRELISIPVQELIQQPNNHGFKRTNHQNDMPQKRAKFDYNRLGMRPVQKSANNCSLELKKVPRGLNNITHLNNHFAKFGKIINIQVNFENDPEAALVTFSTHAEANAAYRSTEAVLNNRFIKVFWRSVQENVPPVQNSQNQIHSSVKDRLGKVLNPVDPSSVQTDENQSSLDGKDKVASVQNKNNVVDNKKEEKIQEMLKAKEQLKKKQEEKRKEAIKLTQDLRKRKQELLEKQLAQQKLLIEKLEKTPSGQHRDLLMSTIKTVQESIESIRKELLPPLPAPGAPKGPTTSAKPHKKTREEAQREVLDVELDLMTRQAEGGDTSELQRRLAELKAQAQRIAPGRGGLGPPGGPAHRRALMRGGRGGVRMMYHLNRASLTLDRTKGPQGEKGIVGGKNVVDHRPKNVLVSGYESDEADAVLAHFAQYGEIVEYLTDSSTPSITLSYKTRKEAEVALVKGRHFRDRTLSVTWCMGAPRARTTSFTSGPQKLVKPVKLDKDEVEKNEEEKLEVKEEEKEVEDAKIEPKAEETVEEPEEKKAEPEEDKENELLLDDADDENMLLTDGDVVSGDADGVVDVSEEVLLQDDEEDDETEDDRSWRR